MPICSAHANVPTDFALEGSIDELIVDFRKFRISNVIWQMEDKSWRRGFFAINGSVSEIRANRHSYNYKRFESIENYDDFEDVMYNYNGYSPEDNVIFYHSEENLEACNKFNKMFKNLKR